MKIRLLLFTLSGLLVLLDQLTKAWVSQVKPYITVIPGVFNIHYVENTGAAFGILQGKQLFLAAVSGVAVIVLIFLIFAEREKRYGLLTALALILGGTIGNLIDRVRLHYVVDFLQFYVQWAGRAYYWPSFNVADAAISTGVGLLLIVTVWHERQLKQTATSS